MKLETFFEKFELFAEAPGAVAKLRELVLELAVQGKLTGQAQDDASERDWKALAGGLDRDAGTAEVEAGFPFAIPPEWNWTTLEGLGDTKPRNHADDDLECAFMPMSLLPAQYGQRAQHELRTWGEIKKGFTHFKDGDVVMAKITPCFQNGKAAAMTDLAGGIGAGTTELHVFRRSSSQVLPGFVLIYLKSPGFVARGVVRMTGSAGQRRVPSDYFAKSPFPLPPLAEQKRIVAKVDELMALCDRLEAQHEERQTRHAALARASLARFADSPTPANLQFLFHPAYAIAPADLRKSILTLAVQGKLVPQDPNDEPAGELIARIERDKVRLAETWGVRTPKKVLPFTADEEPYDIPKSWQWIRIGQLAVVIDYGTSHKANSDASTVPVYRMGNIQGGRLVDENLKYVDPSIDDLPSLYLKTNDVLFNRTNSYELVGKSGIFTGPDDMATFASYLIRIRFPTKLTCPSFFNLALNAPYFRKTQIEPEVVQQCGQANFNGTKLASTVVPFPPLAEQKRIVAKVDQLMAILDELEAQLIDSRAAGEGLLDALVADFNAGPGSRS